jgi:hypothetical protein
MPLFEVAILEIPSKKEKEEGAIEKLVYGPTAIIAREAQTASVVAALEAKEKVDIDPTKVSILVRPFA